MALINDAQCYAEISHLAPVYSRCGRLVEFFLVAGPSVATLSEQPAPTANARPVKIKFLGLIIVIVMMKALADFAYLVFAQGRWF